MNGLKRVVITGSGIYSALGFTPGELFDNLAAGKSAVVRAGEEEHFLPTAPAPRDPERFRVLPRTLRRAMAPSACLPIKPTSTPARKAPYRARRSSSQERYSLSSWR